jgi:hypothetical protein
MLVHTYQRFLGVIGSGRRFWWNEIVVFNHISVVTADRHGLRMMLCLNVDLLSNKNAVLIIRT